MKLQIPSRTRLAYLCFAALILATPIHAPVAADKKPAPNTQSKSGSRTLPIQSQRSLELNEQGVVAIKARNFPQAEALFKRAIETDPRNLTAVFNLAGMYIANKKESEAISLLTSYTRDFPDDPGLYARLGDAHFSAQNPTAATAAYEKALALEPNYPTIPSRLGTLYTLQKKLDKAAVMYERAIKINPRDTQSLQNLGNIYLGLGKPQQAIAAAKKAIQVSSTAEAYITLGTAYRDLKDDKNALISFQRAQQLGYKDPKLAQVIEELEGRTARKTT